jgi:diguanylate cyclase (GGDEF)-like protein
MKSIFIRAWQVFGGDEFSAYLSPCERAAGLRIAEQIRQTILNHSFKIDEIDVHPSISIGISSLPRDGTSAGELFVRADEALYRAKKAGRNRVSE